MLRLFFAQDVDAHDLLRRSAGLVWAMEALPDPEDLAVRFLEGKLRGRAPEEREKKRLSDALARRGFSWSDVRAAWRRLDTEIDVE